MTPLRLALYGLAWLFALPAQADEGATKLSASAKSIAYPEVTQWLFALCAVLAVFGLFVWLLRKTGRIWQGKQALSVVTGISLGVREKLVLVQVGEKQLLLGVTPGRIEKLLELEGDARLLQSQPASNDTATFAQKLQQVLQAKHSG